MTTKTDYLLFKNSSKADTVSRVRSLPVEHLSSFLCGHYPEIKEQTTSERVNFFIFLLEKALDKKCEDYSVSWSDTESNKDLF
ncbi:MAG: hypothetical protein V2I33_03980 [Kangiellaceae bacterium]|nr:hypothetical protein [Kangiellaceae bacterium]